jgi:hypothetical protein
MFFGGNGNTAAPPVSKFGTPAKVANNATGSATTLAAPAVNTANGDLTVVAAKSGSVAGTPSSVTDTAGDTYTPLTAQINGSSGLRLFYCTGATANASNVVTVPQSSHARRETPARSPAKG